MKQINLKIADSAHVLLRRLAEDSGVTSAKVIELALESLERERVTPTEVGFDHRVREGRPVTLEIPPAPPPLEYGEEDPDDLSDVLGKVYGPPEAAPIQSVDAPSTTPAPPPEPNEDDLTGLLGQFGDL